MSMAKEEEKNKEPSGTREISFHDLVQQTRRPAPARPGRKGRTRRTTELDDPYYRVIDAGHDLLMTTKLNKELVENLPAELRKMLLELESIAKEITLSAVEDDFDYRVKLNRYYFHMIRVHFLASVMSSRVSRVLGNSAAAAKILGNPGPKKMASFLDGLKAFSEIGEELTTASGLFMNNMEAEKMLDKDILQARQIAEDKALEMIQKG